jgi:hypothetical protein
MGTVASDQEAFDHIRGRLTGDVGGIIKLVDETKIHHVPFWSLLRCIFPVAEAVADLIHYPTENGTAKRLTLLLQNEFDGVRAGYRPVAATLTLLYRHSLTHQDLPRVLLSGGREVVWRLAHRGGHHLRITTNGPPGSFTVEVDPGALYDDLVAVISSAALRSWGGAIKDRYNTWSVYDLGHLSKPTATEKLAAIEIAALRA